jgi:H/ACA ribonucleoprotein complex subunit 4
MASKGALILRHLRVWRALLFDGSVRRVRRSLVLELALILQELRQVRVGILGEKENMVTMHAVLDAQWLYENTGDETLLGEVVMPVEVLLTRLVVKSAVDDICLGGAAKYSQSFWAPGLLRFEDDIKVDDKVNGSFETKVFCYFTFRRRT